jgi:hypothetical protein
LQRLLPISPGRHRTPTAARKTYEYRVEEFALAHLAVLRRHDQPQACVQAIKRGATPLAAVELLASSAQ